MGYFSSENSTEVERRLDRVMLRPAQKSDFGLQAFDLAPQTADQPERLPIHAMLAAVALEPPQFVDRIIIHSLV